MTYYVIEMEVINVFPSLLILTLVPCWAKSLGIPINLACCDQVTPFLVKIQVAPTPLSSIGPPTAIVVASLFIETLVPCCEFPILFPIN